MHLKPIPASCTPPVPGINSGLSAHSGRLEKLDRVICQSRQMLENAGSENWDRVAEIEALRRDELLDCFVNSVTDSEVEPVRERLEQLMKLTDELHALVVSAREQKLESLNQFASGRTAVKAYGESA